MASPYFVPVQVDVDPEPIVLSIRDRITADLFQALPTGYPVPVLDLLRGRWLCVHRGSSPSQPWRTSRGHVLAELNDAPPPFEPWLDPVLVTDEDVQRLIAAGPCEVPTRDALPELRAAAERIARLRARRARTW